MFISAKLGSIGDFTPAFGKQWGIVVSKGFRLVEQQTFLNANNGVLCVYKTFAKVSQNEDIAYPEDSNDAAQEKYFEEIGHCFGLNYPADKKHKECCGSCYYR